MTSQERFRKFIEENKDLALRTSVLDCQIAIRRLLDDLAAAREDVADADWLEVSFALVNPNGNPAGGVMWVVEVDGVAYEGDTRRAAVRAARAGGTRS